MIPVEFSCTTTSACDLALASNQGRSSPGILVVDREVLIGQMLHRALPRFGFRVWDARNEASAIDLYRRHGQDISVVLLDVRTRGQAGLKTFAALRALNADVRCCFTTGDLELQDYAYWLRQGAAGFIPKPFDLVDLVDRLQTIATASLRSLDIQGIAHAG